MDEILDLLRAAWRDDPVTFAGEHYPLTDIRFLPKPAHDIPIWIGGGVEASFRRAIDKGDGFHVVGLKPSDLPPIVERLRRDRPEPEFTIRSEEHTSELQSLIRISYSVFSLKKQII